MFKALQIYPSPHGEWYEGRFQFQNQTSAEVLIPIATRMPDGTIIPHYVGYEVQDHEGKWVPVPVGYDGIPQSLALKPNSSAQFVIDLSPLRDRGRAFTARVEISGFRSEPFRIDYARDRLQSGFEKARRQHLDEIRELLTIAGFSQSVLTPGRTPEHLLRAVLKPLEQEYLGFEALRGDLQIVSRLTESGNLRFDFHNMQLADHQYQYSGLLVINPNSFSPTWFRAEMQQYARTEQRDGMWILSFDDGTGFYTDENRLFLQLRYRPAIPERCPSESEAKRLLTEILETLGKCLRESEREAP